jgi:voltage-gated potassium channel Kch
MTGASAPEQRRPALIERRIRKIANARSITLALAGTFVGLAVAGAIAIRFLDEKSFPTFGSAFWWALQTVTTVGYGDVVPTGTTGKVIGSIEMVLGVSFISFLTAGVTSAVVRRSQSSTAASTGSAEDVDHRSRPAPVDRLNHEPGCAGREHGGRHGVHSLSPHEECGEEG